jgi:hypothetical protein
MKKSLSIIMALLLLTTSSPTNQGVQTMVKLGGFFHHFIHHIACHQEEIGILDFVQLHYSDHEHHEADHDEHEKLPFNHHSEHQNLTPQSPCLLPQHNEMLAFGNQGNFSNPLILHSQQWLSSLFSGDIWQPPKA